MKAYLDIVDRIIKQGEQRPNRTGVDALTIAGAIFEHDMAEGFPLLTTKFVAKKAMATELEFFIKGLTDKKWLQDRNCHIWDSWCSPDKVPHGHDEKTKELMLAERELGPIYGWQWRHFNGEYKDYQTDYTGVGIDQLQNVIDKLKSNPDDRRMIVSAWNPSVIGRMALPPCHYGFQVTVVNGKLNLLWNQRSVDTMIGLPFNIASYGLLLHLLAKEAGFAEGKLVGLLADTHIYINHLEGAREQLSRDSTLYPLAKARTDNFTSIFDWMATDTEFIDYQSYPKIEFEIAV